MSDQKSGKQIWIRGKDIIRQCGISRTQLYVYITDCGLRHYKDMNVHARYRPGELEFDVAPEDREPDYREDHKLIDQIIPNLWFIESEVENMVGKDCPNRNTFPSNIITKSEKGGLDEQEKGLVEQNNPEQQRNS